MARALSSVQLAKIALAAVLLGVLAGCGGEGNAGLSPPPTFSVGGAVTGLVGSVVLQNNAGGDLTVTSSGIFTFAGSLNSGAAYVVTVLTQPGLQTCLVANGSGTASANVTNVEIACADVAPPTLSLSFAKTKVFRIAWDRVSSIDHYRLFEAANGSADFTQVGDNIPASVTSIEQVTALHSRFDARYTLQACGESRCFDSNEVSVTGALADAIGYFKASNPHVRGEFGFSVALSADGRTMAVGASGERSLATGINGDQNAGTSSAGAVYVFVRDGNGWIQQAYVKASNTHPVAGVPGDRFGTSVALSADGSVLAVGADREDSGATGVNGIQQDETARDSGAVYVFSRADTVWSQQAYIKASNTERLDHFGERVALSGDGRTLAVAASLEDSNASGVDNPGTDDSFESGAVYVFANAGQWIQQAYIKASNTGEGDLFGSSLALDTEGSTLAVGAIREDSRNDEAADSGAVYVFGRVATTWSEQGYLKASNTQAEDEFGFAVALSADGSTLAVGAHREDSVGAVAGESDNSAESSGAVYIFARAASNQWAAQEAYLKASNADAGDFFGSALALSADGQTLVVGAIGEASRSAGIGGDETDNNGDQVGAAYVFKRADASWSQQAYLKPSNADSAFNSAIALFGMSVAISADAGEVAVGAPNEDGNAPGINGDETSGPLTSAGAVYLY